MSSKLERAGRQGVFRLSDAGDHQPRLHERGMVAFCELTVHSHHRCTIDRYTRPGRQSQDRIMKRYLRMGDTRGSQRDDNSRGLNSWVGLAKPVRSSRDYKFHVTVLSRAIVSTSASNLRYQTREKNTHKHTYSRYHQTRFQDSVPSPNCSGPDSSGPTSILHVILGTCVGTKMPQFWLSG